LKEFRMTPLPDPREQATASARCELIDPHGSDAGVWERDYRPPRFCSFINLLGATVSDVFIDDASTLRLRFADGRQLLLVDESVEEESFRVDDLSL
jgi:hypothetical protein